MINAPANWKMYGKANSGANLSNLGNSPGILGIFGTSHFWTNHETSRWMINPSAANLRASLRRGGLEMVGQKSLVFMAKWLGSMDVHPSQLMIQFQPWFHRCFYLFWYSSDLRFHWSQVWSRPVVGVSGLAHGQMEDEMGHTKHLKWQQLGRDQIAGCLFFF